MASRLIAQMIVQSTAVVTRVFISAYKQAISNAKSGGGNVQDLSKPLRTKMKSDEALKILNLEMPIGKKEDVDTIYIKMFELNDPKKGGSFYLQSKIFRAHECIINEHFFDQMLKDKAATNSKENDKK